MKRGMNKFFSILLVLCMLISLVPMAAFAASPDVLYLKPNSNWFNDGARFAAYFFGAGETWVSMSDSDGDGVYECDVPSGYPNVIFCRMNPGSSANDWNNKWNQTSDLVIPSDGTNCYTVAAGTWDQGGGSWSKISNEPATVDYYLFGYINGANYGCEEDVANLGSYKFSDGKLTATFNVESYVGVKTGDNANWYMTEGFQGTSKSVTLFNTNTDLANADKLYVPAGIKVTFTLTKNADGTLTLKYSTTASSCKHLYYTDGKCNACGAGCSHNWDGNTCTKCGTVCDHTWSNGFCSVCGIACDHSYSGNKCTICGNAKPSCSHSYSSKVTTAATCEKAGVKTYTCSKCGDTYTQPIAATGHSYASKTTAATCTEQGYTTYTCSKCSDSYKADYVDAKGHSYSSGTCTVCGAVDSGYTLNYYLVGYINGANYGCEEDYQNMGSYKFSGGKLTATFDQDSYVFLKTEGNGAWYLAESYCTDTVCSFVIGGTEKMFVPGGVQVTFILTENSDGSLTLKYTKTASSCQHLTHSQEGKCSVCGASVSHTWSSGVCSCGLKCSHASHNQSGVCSTCGVSVSHSYSGNKCTVCGKVTSASTVKIHFVDAMVWQNVTAHIWKVKGGTTTTLNAWPGEILNRDANGYFTIELDYKPTSGESLGFIFTNFNGGQTADTIVDYATLSSGEIWIKPNNWTNGEGKYDCYVTTVESSMVLSPEIHGNSVTFRYEDSSASKVYVAGSFNGWSTTANKLTKGSDGIWTTTMTLSEGVYEYKFVVDGQWILDPKNGLIGGYDGNSLVIIGNAGSTTASDITVKLHFYRESGDYANWDAWMWSSTNEGQGCSFYDDPVYKGKTATFTIPGGSNAWVNYKIRKTDWSDEEFYTRSIDISNIASGTVHFFLNSGSAIGSTVYGNDVIKMGKPTYANLDYNSGNIWVKTPLPVSGDFTKAFSVVKSDGSASGISVTGVTMDNNGYSLSLSRKPALIEVHDLVVKCGTTVGVETDGLFYSGGFAADYTYYGNDLGATWSKKSTTFKVWAPTATGVSVILYRGGNHGGDDWISTTPMTLGEKGVYSVTISGDLDGVYYNYLVNFPDYTTEATDPYAKTTGANGDRGMIINMDAYDPEGWDRDLSPNQGMNYTDAIIYEMHIREMTIDASSGVKEEWRGKYLGLTQEGTNYQGRATALDHIKELGVTHVQLMPTYDHAGVDEYHLTDWQQYAWGYNPKNFNVPEGSFATDPYNGEVRVTEMKQMIQAFHSKGINVVMDVVYNHTFSGGDFCYNKIVPNYFSRFWAENNWSNGSGVGNDFATERSMGRNYIVDSIFYWVEEYHIDGFRFDLAGLIDIQTMNEVISTVQARYPYVIFYGEGWTVGGTAIQDGHWTATKENAWQTGSLAFYNDSFRNDIAGDNGNNWGFATGDSGKANKIGDYFRASNGWSSSPSQTINYVSCHDNYTLIDKIIISRNGAYWDQMVKMNNMSAALYMLAQGIPYIYSGEELLREKKDEWGNRYHNTYDSSDYITKIRWDDLVNKEFAQVTDDYYAGLVNFRKNHAALRCTNGGDAWGYTSFHKINDHCVLFYVSGYPNYECSDGIVIIYNANEGTQWLNIYDYGVPYGNWQACIHGMQAGVNPLWSTYDGGVGVEGLSTTVLVLGDLVHEESVYNNQSYSCSHGYHNQSGLCWDCGAKVDHYFVNGYCNHCNLSQSATGTMTLYYDNSASQWGNVYAYAWTETGGRTTTYTESWPGTQMTSVGNNIFAVTVPCAANNVIFTDNYGNQTITQGIIKNDNGVLTSNLYYSASGSWGNYTETCPHENHNGEGICSNCGVDVGHNWQNGYCAGCKVTCDHAEHSKAGKCYTCGLTVSHSWQSGTCTGCGATCSHSWSSGKCTNCGMTCSHSGHDQNGSCYTCGSSVGHSYSGGLCSTCGSYKAGYIESQSYYLVGYINGANYGCEDDYQNLGSYKFTSGKLTATFSSDSYVFVKTGDNGSFYMTDGYQEGASSATLHDSRTVAGDKLYVPGGKEVTFTLTVNSSNNTMVLSYTVEDPVCSHSYTSKVTTAATCTKEGVKTFTCTKCGDSYTQSIAATGHNYTSKVTTAATCTKEGVETYTCSKCSDSYTQAIPVIVHSYSDGSCTSCGALDPGYIVTDSGFVLVTDASQITAGGKFVLVANNNGTYQAMGTSLTGGKFDPVTVTVDGRMVTGSNLPVWTVEKVSGGIAISLNGEHLSYSSGTSFKMAPSAYTWTVTEGSNGYILNSSATSRGIYYSISAAKFGAYSTTYVNSSSYISNLQLYKYQVGTQGCAHSYTSSVTTAATCEDAGVRTYTCYLCGNSYTEAIPATGHSYASSVTTAATCTTAGVKTYTCSKCSASYIEPIPATGHSFVNGSCTACGAVDPSVSGGTTYYLVGYINGADYGCEGDYETMGIYKFVNGKLTATFSQDSYIFVKTEGNGKWLLADAYCEDTTCTFKEGGAEKMYVPGGVELTFTLTENDDGSVTVSYTKMTTGCDHSYTSKVTTAATCTTAGVKTYTCSKCSASHIEPIPATGHNYVNGKCSNCGTAKPTVDYYLFGYINGANYACEEDYENSGVYKFEDGTLTAIFDCDSYVGVKTGDNAKWYMTEGWQGEVSSVTLYDTMTITDVNKMYVPGNVKVTFNLAENAAGSLTLSYVTAPAECRHTYTATQVKAATCTSYATYSLTCSACGDYYTVSADTLAQQWLYAVPTGMSSSSFTGQTMYRYRDYTSGGWVALGTNTIRYVKSWPSGFDTSNSLYSQYNNAGKKVTGYETDSSKLTVDSDAIIGYLYYHWCYDGYPYTVANKTGSYNRFHAYFSTKTPSEANKHDASDDSYRFDDSTACDDSVWYFAVPVYGQTYTTYTNGSGWGSWSDWSATKVTASSTREVETATMYRYKAASLAAHKYVGGTCSICGDGCSHSYTSSVTTAATCVSGGIKTYTCSKCSHSYTEGIAATGHSYSDGACTVCGAADPSAPGNTVYYLVGYINGADYGCEGDWENMGIYKFVGGKLTATFTEDSYVFVKTEGNTRWLLADAYCTDTTCTFAEGGTEKMFVPGGVEVTFTLTENPDGSVTVSYARGGSAECDHSYTSSVTTAATCTAAGVKTYTCTKCGASYTQSIPATGHSFVNGSCTACGAADPSVVGTTYYLVGYINGADYGCEGDYENMGQYKFVNGKLTATFTEDSYVFVKTEGNGKWLLSEAYCTDTVCTFAEGGSEKLFVPGNVQVTFTLSENANGSVTVSYTTGSSAASKVPTLTLKAPTLEFKDMICVVAFYTAENIDDVVEMGMITYSSKVSNVSVATAEHVIPGATYEPDSGRYFSGSQGIHAKYLGDTVYLAIYAKLSDGTYAYSKLASYSAVQYATNQLKNSTDTALKQLVAAMLNYGAEAQLYFGHNTSALANASLTAAQKALPEAYRADMSSSVPSVAVSKQGVFINNQGFASRKPAISFEGAFCINYFFTPNYAPDSGITLYYWNAEDFNAASVLTTSNATGKFKLEGSGTGEYRGDITGIAAKALSEAVYVAAAYKSGGTVWTSGVLGYSIGAYCSSQASKGGDVAELAKATAVYGYHAKQYFG